jgi:hypothetical protein
MNTLVRIRAKDLILESVENSSYAINSNELMTEMAGCDPALENGYILATIMFTPGSKSNPPQARQLLLNIYGSELGNHYNSRHSRSLPSIV